MTISERINLHRCGYSRAEIDELAKQEREERNQNPEPEKEAPNPEPEKEAPNPEPEKDPVLDAINKLTEAIQGSNINRKAQPENPEQTIDDLIKQV